MRTKPKTRATPDNPWALTPAEIVTLEALTRHGALTATATALGRSYRTVDKRLIQIRAKMQTHTIGCCVVWAKWQLDSVDLIGSGDATETPSVHHQPHLRPTTTRRRRKTHTSCHERT